MSCHCCLLCVLILSLSLLFLLILILFLLILFLLLLLLLLRPYTFHIQTHLGTYVSYVCTLCLYLCFLSIHTLCIPVLPLSIYTSAYYISCPYAHLMYTCASSLYIHLSILGFLSIYTPQHIRFPQSPPQYVSAYIHTPHPIHTEAFVVCQQFDPPANLTSDQLRHLLAAEVCVCVGGVCSVYVVCSCVRENTVCHDAFSSIQISNTLPPHHHPTPHTPTGHQVPPHPPRPPPHTSHPLYRVR